MGLFTPCFVPRGGVLYTMIVPEGEFLPPSSHVLGGMVLDEIDTCINCTSKVMVVVTFSGIHKDFQEYIRVFQNSLFLTLSKATLNCLGVSVSFGSFSIKQVFNLRTLVTLTPCKIIRFVNTSSSVSLMIVSCLTKKLYLLKT